MKQLKMKTKHGEEFTLAITDDGLIDLDLPASMISPSSFALMDIYEATTMMEWLADAIADISEGLR